MGDGLNVRVPVVGALGYVERLRALPESFSATLVVEPDNRYFRHAIAVHAGGAKVGYVAPEVAANLYEAIAGAAQPPTCAARRASRSDHATSGMELLLDLSSLTLTITS